MRLLLICFFVPCVGPLGMPSYAEGPHYSRVGIMRMRRVPSIPSLEFLGVALDLTIPVRKWESLVILTGVYKKNNTPIVPAYKGNYPDPLEKGPAGQLFFCRRR